MKTLVLQHSEGSPPGLVIPWLQKNQNDYVLIRVDRGELDQITEPFNQVIICGGEPNVDQDHLFPWLKEERRLIEKFISEGKKIVGLCLGSQLCAQILGARVHAHPVGWEVGWHSVDLVAMPALAGFEQARSLPVFHYHRYVFETPSGATVLAKNDWWPDQAYLWNNQILGTQFHPETDLDWNKQCAEEPLPPGEKVQSKEQILQDGRRFQPSAGEWFFKVMDGFLSTTQPDHSLESQNPNE